MREGEYVESLISEYEIVLGKRELKDAQGGFSESRILEELSVSAEWSVTGARELLRLAEKYGAFMLRNALAIAVVLGKEAKCLSPTGREFRPDRIEFLLEEREIKARHRRAGGRTKGPKKRTKEDDQRFEASLEKVIVKKAVSPRSQ